MTQLSDATGRSTPCHTDATYSPSSPSGRWAS